MENKMVTNHQLFTFTGLSILGGSLLVISSSVAAAARQDAWISPLVTMVVGVFMMWLYYYLGTRYEGLTLIGICQKIFGKWIGKIVAAGYIVFLFSTTYGIPWWIGSFGAHIMHETPVPVIILPYAAALVIAVYYGLESIVRASELAYIYVSALFALSIILVLPNARIDYIQPVLENGVLPIIKGAYLLSSIIIFPGIVLLMIFPSNVSDVKGGKKALIKGFLWCNAIVFITIFASILVLGSAVAAKSLFPTLLLAREINLGTVLTRLEYAISSMWTVSEFMIGILFFYACVKALSELIGLKDHTKIAAPLGLIVLLYAWIIYPNSDEEFNFIITGFTPHATLFGFALPVLMTFIYLFKRLFKKV